jgi:hypothetical protein
MEFCKKAFGDREKVDDFSLDKTECITGVFRRGGSQELWSEHYIVFRALYQPPHHLLERADQDKEHDTAGEVEDQMSICHLLARIAAYHPCKQGQLPEEWQEEQDPKEDEEEMGNRSTLC